MNKKLIICAVILFLVYLYYKSKEPEKPPEENIGLWEIINNFWEKIFGKPLIPNNEPPNNGGGGNGGGGGGSLYQGYRISIPFGHTLTFTKLTDDSPFIILFTKVGGLWGPNIPDLTNVPCILLPERYTPEGHKIKCGV